MKIHELRKAFPDVSRADLNFLLCHLFRCNPAQLAQVKEIAEAQIPHLYGWLERLRKGEPPQYIVQKAWFYGLEFQVDTRVLIPRYDTEVLVQALLHKLRGNESILEIGIGSGVISICLQSYFPELNIHATDIDARALEVAHLNIKRRGMDIKLFEADLFPDTDQKYDLIVSNPPYIAPDEYLNLEAKVRDYEPRIALLAEAEGLACYKAILSRVHHYLNEQALLAFEHGVSQQQALQNLTESAGFKTLQKGKDLAMRDRFLILQKT
jgi:release factor glutamine methyltransferase